MAFLLVGANRHIPLLQLSLVLSMDVDNICARHIRRINSVVAINLKTKTVQQNYTAPVAEYLTICYLKRVPPLLPLKL